MKENDYLVFKYPDGSTGVLQREFYEGYILLIKKINDVYQRFQEELKVLQSESKEYESYWAKRGL